MSKVFLKFAHGIFEVVDIYGGLRIFEDGLTDRQLELLYKWLKVLTTDP